MHDPEAVFSRLALAERHSFLDLGCGPGDYALDAAGRVGNAGVVYALDKSSHMIEALKKRAEDRGFKNVQAMAVNILDPLPIENGRIHGCLLSTVLHIFDLSEVRQKLFREIRRVLRPDGCLAIIECKKEAQPFGPPRHMRLSPEEIEDSITPVGFIKKELTDLGYNYMLTFIVV
ncbi:MAG: class I SAM-dependent methyltransferase [Desulfobacteraceae bacterium]|jgi:ubiquinone/menaquinone biosynthesis C-methylase UbiE